MINDPKTSKAMTTLKVLDAVLSSVTRTVVIFLAVVTGLTLGGVAFGTTLLDNLLLAGSIAAGSLLFDFIAGGLRYFSELMIRREVNRLLGDLKDMAVKESLRTPTNLPSLPTDNGNLN